MGGTTEPIIAALKDSYTENASLREAVTIAVDALRVGIASNGSTSSSSSSTTELRKLDVSTLEVAILDASRATPRLPSHHGFRVGGASAEA